MRLPRPHLARPARAAALGVGAVALVAGGLTAALPAVPGAAPPAGAATPLRVLFDNAHAQTAGNADWIISTSQPSPYNQKSAPTVETDWTGAISAWGVSLAQYPTEYRLATNPSGRSLTYGSTSNAQDLANYDVLVIDEPNTAFTAAERKAIMTFVQNGGGLYLIVDHDQSDRNNDGVDSVDIANQLFSSNGVDDTNPFGLTVAYQNISSENTANLGSGASTHPVVKGAWGTASTSILRGATTSTLSTAANPNAKCLLYRAGVSNTGSTGCFIAVSTFGSGRVILWGDSSPVDDGTGQSGNTLYDGWNDPAGTNAAWALNGTDWLGRLS
ncbi:ThuA domain-containing protein [Nocardioides sp. TRM66260-LWL]|uniref:ThuA domain-containing protein n=1 Tax=Nocardioides sp. TRM66260-LWL TaxID=2874478 RepID=UPI001CC4C6B2|nr:ThuA domain-containing protein [Nocardioides sp. TRM66260-LWL]MBZ5736286.1 ThuA domain-containing protein [Nocardioides sp. TRM66260-LWL]